MILFRNFRKFSRMRQELKAMNGQKFRYTPVMFGAESSILGASP
jgi:hypothetical protein